VQHTTPDDHLHGKPWILDSIEVLLEVACQEAGADGFAFHEFEQATARFVRRAVRGMPKPLGSAASYEKPAIISYPLEGRNGLAGTLDFAFADVGKAGPGYREVLQHAVDAVQTLLKAAGSSSFLTQLTARISEIEGRLAGLKIRERAQGLLSRETQYSRIEVLNSHVAGALQLGELEQVLSRRLEEAEHRLADRQIVSQAKAALERNLGLTEEEAYNRLREVSRRTRTKLSEVAARVLRRF